MSNTQNKVTANSSFDKDELNQERTSSFSLECRNRMVQFKTKLKSKKFTKEELYKICPVCKKIVELF